MASSSNQGEASQTEPPHLAANSSDKHAGPTPPQPPPPPKPTPTTTTYPTHPPPGSAYPPEGYPSVPGGQNHHAYHQAYALYPNGYPPGYHYPPTAPYYGPPPPYPAASVGGTSAGVRFYRSFILCCCILLTFLFLASLVLALVLRPQLPIYKVLSMSVTNFTVTPTLTGEWNTKMYIENPNDKLRAFFSDLRVDVVYKDGVVAVNYAPGFTLDKKEVTEIGVTGSSSHANEALMDKTTMVDLVKDRTTGSVTFSLRLTSINAFKSGSFSTRSTQIVALCDGLKLVFQNNNSTGVLNNGGNPIECELYV
ncbi:uncharacterized protein LOC133306626 [Gastrolobium bilobum]|uniref:uncharacterized protein LOC133306626 n=1 Tax=Gastrolobium bilobum TaxID=150636 RepID=UPI002AB2E5D7|nr:uncharacterized protein LOC133306626 [Gastrolobium bilobum]